MKKHLLGMIALFVLAFTQSACGPRPPKDNPQQHNEGVVQVLYFHGNQRCVTCRAIEKQCLELLDTEYAEAQKNGLLRFRSINFSDRENETTANRYEVTWSSLILDKDSQVVNLTDMAFRYAKSEPATFKVQLKQEIDKLLQ